MDRMTGSPAIIEIQCGSCGARISIEGGQLTTRCPFCDAPSVVTRPAAEGRPKPVFALGFLIGRDAALEAVSQWIRRQRMAPFGLRRFAIERIAGVYLPACLYSASKSTRYQASIAETYRRLRVQDVSDSRISVGNRDETEYRDLAGRHVAYVTDVLVTASNSVSNEELAAIEPFDLGRLRHHSAALVAGWAAEEPSRSPEECLRLARAEAEAAVPGVLHRFMPGDGVRALRHATEFQEESIDPILIPVWVFALRYHPAKPPLRLLVNGQTGKVGGTIPVSWAKLSALVAMGVGSVVILVLALRALARFVL